ncbi:TPA: hypothetical protein R8G49_005332 [Citrobacter freundii]|nr:hypothetical protein [Citrobacter freundii]
MTALNKQALRNTANRDWFESWFKSEFHPDKTGPYIKDQLFFAVQAARKPLLDELEAAEKRIAEAYAGWGNCQLTMGVYCHAYEEAKTHIAELIHNHRVHAARLIDERIVLKERIAELEARKPYVYLMQCDGQIQISIGSEQPNNRSGGYATPWFAIYTAAAGKGEAS